MLAKIFLLSSTKKCKYHRQTVTAEIFFPLTLADRQGGISDPAPKKNAVQFD